jgi:eukaryotic-like serine/threonine-protein kinase
MIDGQDMGSEQNGSMVRLAHFALQEDLGADAIGTWHRAVDTRLERSVRLRIWRLGNALRPAEVKAARTRVKERARAAAAVSHASLPTVFALEKVGDADIVSTEHVEGALLSDALRRGERWRPVEAAAWLAGISDALVSIHAAGLVHGHVDPEHILLTPDGRAVLLGLGIATSPEEARGEVNPRPESDVLALGAVLRAMTAPRPPVESEDGETEATDPGLAVEAEFLDSLLLPALHEEPPRAAAVRDALLRATRDASDPGDWRLRAQRRAKERKVDFTAPPTPPPTGSGPIPILLPDDEGGRSRRTSLSVGAILVGLLLGAGVVHAWRTGALSGWVEELNALQSATPAFELPETSGPVAMTPPPAPLLIDTAPPRSAVTPADTANGSNPTAGDPGTVDPDTTTAVATAEPPRDTARTEPPVATPPPPPPTARRMTAGVSVTPGDAVISRSSDRAFLGLGRAEVTVQSGDSLMLEFNRPGYVAERRAYRGEPLQVVLAPDSVTVAFASNQPAEITVMGPAGSRVLGTTDLTARLPTGRYRVRFRAEGLPDWRTEVALTEAGRTYEVSKRDYPTRGGLVITVAGTWALVSLDGGAERESPARFDDLTAGPHVIRLTRPGFETVVDTVRVAPGGTTTRQYTIRPSR